MCGSDALLRDRSPDFSEGAAPGARLRRTGQASLEQRPGPEPAGLVRVHLREPTGAARARVAGATAGAAARRVAAAGVDGRAAAAARSPPKIARHLGPGDHEAHARGPGQVDGLRRRVPTNRGRAVRRVRATVRVHGCMRGRATPRASTAPSESTLPLSRRSELISKIYAAAGLMLW